MYNSWYGKFHLEMHWWHAAHFPLWGRVHLLEKSLWWYRSILPKAKELAAVQGYAGARWPKTVGPTGNRALAHPTAAHLGTAAPDYPGGTLLPDPSGPGDAGEI